MEPCGILGFIILICLFPLIILVTEEYKKQSRLQKTRLELEKKANRDAERRAKQLEASEEYKKELQIEIDNKKEDFFEKIEKKIIDKSVLIKIKNRKLEVYKIMSIYKKDMRINTGWWYLLSTIQVYIDLNLSFICCSEFDNSKIEIIEYDKILELDELFDDKLREF